MYMQEVLRQLLPMQQFICKIRQSYINMHIYYILCIFIFHAHMHYINMSAVMSQIRNLNSAMQAYYSYIYDIYICIYAATIKREWGCVNVLLAADCAVAHIHMLVYMYVCGLCNAMTLNGVKQSSSRNRWRRVLHSLLAACWKYSTTLSFDCEMLLFSNF